MALTDFLFNGSPPPSVTNTSTAVQGLPDWYQDYQKGILAKANAIANSPYPAYSGELIAPQGALTVAAQQQAQNLPNVGQPAQAAGQGALQSIANRGGAVDQNVFNSYLSPYTNGVVDQIARLGQRNLTENLLPQVNDTFTGAGQFGSGRNADFTGRVVRDANESILNQQAGALQAAYQGAMTGYLNGQGQLAGAGSSLGQLGLNQHSAGIADVASLDQLGQGQQTTQQNLDTALKTEFQNQANYPRQNIGFLQSILSGQQVPTSTTTVSNGPGNNYQPSALAQLAGAASGAAALSKLLG